MVSQGIVKGAGIFSPSLCICVSLRIYDWLIRDLFGISL